MLVEKLTPLNILGEHIRVDAVNTCDYMIRPSAFGVNGAETHVPPVLQSRTLVARRNFRRENGRNTRYNIFDKGYVLTKWGIKEAGYLPKLTV